MTTISQLLRRTVPLWRNNTNASATMMMLVWSKQIVQTHRPFLFMAASASTCAIGILSHVTLTGLSNEDDIICQEGRESNKFSAAVSSSRWTNDSFWVTSFLSPLCHCYYNHHVATTTTTTTTTYCESATTTASTSNVITTTTKNDSALVTATSTTATATKSNIQRQMTSIGRFALVSETKYNPSIITFVLQLENNSQNPKQLTANDFIHLWSLKGMPERHPRFHQILNETCNHLNSSKKPRMKSSSSSSLSFHPTNITEISQHVTESILPSNRFELQRIISKMQLAQWDLSNSLWHVTICNNNRNRSTLSMPLYSMKTGTNIPSSYLTVEGSDHTFHETNSGRQLPPTLLLFRGHHVLADGASMAAAFMDVFDEADLLRNQIQSAVEQYRLRRKRRKGTIWQLLWRKWVQFVQLCYGTILSFMHMIRLMYYQAFVDRNPWKVIKHQSKIGETSVGDAARTVSWSDVASVEQVKWVADTLSDSGKNKKKSSLKITVNDVFTACVTAAMSKQLQYHRQRMQELSLKKSPDAKSENTTVLDEQKFLHVAVPVHLKGGVVLPNESVSNCIGALVARVPCEMNEDESRDDGRSTTNPSVDRLRAVSSELHAIKRTPTAIISFIMAKVLSNITAMNIFPSSWMSYLYANANAGSMVVVSNNRGPSIPVHIDGHKVESITGFVPLPPGIPVGVVVMSYAGRINCALSAEPWAIPDGDQFMLWILEEYLQLVDAAKVKQSKQNIL